MNNFELYPSLTFQNYDESLVSHLRNVVNHPLVSAFRLEFTESVPGNFIKFLLPLLHDHDVALMLSPAEIIADGTLPLKECDGLHFHDISALKTGLPFLKTFSIQTGCFCTTLDDAMYAGEAGADYVSFPADSYEVIEKWSSFAELPCVAEAPSSPESALEAVKKGAEFISFPLKADKSDFDWIRALTTR